MISEGGLLSTPVEVELGVYRPSLVGLDGLPAVGEPQGRSLASTEYLPLPRSTSEAVIVIEKEQGAPMSGAMKRPDAWGFGRAGVSGINAAGWAGAHARGEG